MYTIKVRVSSLKVALVGRNKETFGKSAYAGSKNILQLSIKLNMNTTQATSPLKIKIFPGEYTYPEAIELVRGKGLYLVSYFTAEQSNPLWEAMDKGLLPEGHYWASSGETPDPDDIHSFRITRNQGSLQASCCYDYPAARLKVAVWCSKPAWLTCPCYGDMIAR